eukprot:8436849-Heterocapsa_arctica.AAC.1
MKGPTALPPLLRPLGFWHCRNLRPPRGRVAGMMRIQTTNNTAITLGTDNMRDDELKTREADEKKEEKRKTIMAKRGLAQVGAPEQEQSA